MHKEVDRKYVSSVVMQDGEKLLASPIYAFGKMGNVNIPMFGIRLLANDFNRFTGNMDWNMETRYLLELWVDDKDIISAKRNNKSYTAKSDIEQIAYDNYLGYMRKNYVHDDIEVLLYCIRDYQLIAVREFAYVNSSGTCKVTTRVHNEYLIPTFTCDLYVNGDGYLRELCGKKLVARDGVYTSKLQGENGMRSVYTYMTVEEARMCVCNDMWKRIYDKIKERGLELSAVQNTSIADLFQTSDFLITM